GNQPPQGNAVLQLGVEGGQEVLGGRLLDELRKAGEVGGGFGLAFLVVCGGEAEFGGEAGADQHGQHASADFLEEFTTMRLRHGTPPHGFGDGNGLPILLTTSARYRWSLLPDALPELVGPAVERIPAKAATGTGRGKSSGR